MQEVFSGCSISYVAICLSQDSFPKIYNFTWTSFREIFQHIFPTLSFIRFDMAKEYILLLERFPIFLPNQLAGEVSDEAVAGGVVDEMVSRTLSHHITTTPLDEEDCDDDGRAISSHISNVNPFSSPLWRKSSIQ